ncbi:MAG: diguanylate cyclase, partial [Candidatus Omnitrophica bacterium]|nr:diguanylate cyclase [Candidatus Omnitrophota bacterium]
MQNENKNITPKRRVEQLVFRDELTNAFNRRYLFQYLPQEISNCKDTKRNLWLFMIDIDDFKILNDKHGHLVGDEILKGVAAILNKCVRSEDTVIRYAGDEFTVILPGGEITDALSVAKRIAKSVSENRFESESGKIISRVNLSIGVANFPDDATESLRLIDLADKALYASKEKGKNRILLASDVSIDVLREKEILERFPCPQLIERDRELESLKSLFTDLDKEKKFKITIVTGDAGVGKTRILDEFAKFILTTDAIYFYSSCSEQNISQSYSFFISNLEKFLRNLKAVAFSKEDILKGLSNSQQALLAGLLPSFRELAQSDYSVEENIPKEELEKQIHESLVNLVVNISSKKVLCILCDDFHLIDKHSLNLILSLKDKNYPILFCSALPLKDLLSPEFSEYPLVAVFDSIKDFLSLQLDLSNLSESGTSQMIDTILIKMESSEEFDSLIYKISKGNPLFIEELLKFLIQKGFIYLQKGKWGKIEINESDIPHSLVEVIQERIKALDRTAQEIITKAAVIGQDFNVDLLNRMGKENEGYILDILESAKKSGIIKQKVTAYGDEMSFVSDEIRKVLCDLVEQDKLKDLHQQLGEIQEGLYSGNLDKIAGELYFHFKKAEDYHRATQYAKRIKESDGIVFDRAVEYAKEILGEIDDKKAEPLSKKSLELIPEIVRLLYLININFVIYPKVSQVVQVPIDQIYQRLTEIFARDEILVFSEIKDILIINGKRYANSALKKSFHDAFLSILKSNHIESLTFKKGLAKKELIAFIECLSKVSEITSLSVLLKSKEITNIVVNEISYEIAARGKRTEERERLEEVMLVDYLLGKISGSGKEDFLEKLEKRPEEIAEAISKMGDMVSKEGQENIANKEAKADVVIKSVQRIANQITQKNPQEWDRYKKSLAKTILNLEPRLRKDVLLQDDTTEIGKSRDIIKELIPEFPDDVVLDLLTDEFAKTKASPTKMRGLIRRFLINPTQKNRLLPLLKERFTRAGLSQDDLPWVFGEKEWKDLDLEQRVRKFSEMTAKDFLSLQIEIDINSLILETFKQNREDLLKIILDKWKEFLRDKTPDIKLKITKIFRGLVDLIPSSKDELFVNLTDFLFDAFRNEKDSDIYSQLIGYLTNPTVALIDRKKYLDAGKIISKLNKENSLDNLPSVQKKYIREALDKISQPARLKEIVNELIKRVDDNAYSADIVEFMIEINNPDLIKMLIDEAMIEDKV